MSQIFRFISCLSISDVAIAYRIPRSTVLKHIKNGDLRVNNEKLIDYYQLVDFMGQPSRGILNDRTEQLLTENEKLKRRIYILEHMIEFKKEIFEKFIIDI